MGENKVIIKTADEYILQFPLEIQEKLQAMRKVIRDSAPDAEEKMSWQMPTFWLHGNLVHFAAFKNHIGLYPGPEGIEAFADKFSGLKYSKGAVQFPIDKPLPFDLISEIVRYRVDRNIKDAEDKLQKNKK
ncbi:MAG: iron chaperone [Eubacteriales bacterium]